MNKGFYLSITVIFVTAILSVSVLPIINKTKKPGEINYISFWNDAEKIFLKKSQREPLYIGENIPVIETNNVCELGKLTALSFLHWVKDHPDGVIAMPTGKTPEMFIEYLKYYKENWKEKEVAHDLKYHGLDLDEFPDTSGLKFVQLDEFYPIDTEQKNSFTYYIRNYYLNLLNIQPENVLGMDLCQVGILKEKGHKQLFPEGKVDLTLVDREPINEREKWQKQAILEAEEFCDAYEEKVRKWGGIGFFLGGIGPDGHVAYNMKGSPHYSKTRLVQLNYPSAAAAAGDLGGIEYSRGKTAVTIGLGTITFNPDATIIIMAAGEAKAPVVYDAIYRQKNTNYPATALQGISGTRFYLTKGAAFKLEARKLEDLQKKRFHEISEQEIDDIIIELAIAKGKRIIDLTQVDLLGKPKTALLLRKFRGNQRDLLHGVLNRLTRKIDKGLNLPQGVTVLHTSPHHDDVMLSYHPLMRKLLKNNNNYFVYLTSGFNSVTNTYMQNTLQRIPENSLVSYSPEILNHDYAYILRSYLNAANNHDIGTMKRTESIIMLKNICRIFNIKNIATLERKVRWLNQDYFTSRHPGEKDSKQIQLLKGAMRESEAERMLLMAGVPLPSICHLRANFYNGDYFNPMPTIEKDAQPFSNLCHQVNPSLVTVALDPEGTGPDTHYKVLQVVAQSLKMGSFNPHMKIWGYRNVWHHFKLSEASIMTPITNQEMKEMNHAFLTCFSTQKNASFPTTNYDGPFSHVAERIQREQFEQLKTLLGEAYFIRHSNPLIRNARGFVFIKEMDMQEFSQSAQDLKSRIELTRESQNSG